VYEAVLFYFLYETIFIIRKFNVYKPTYGLIQIVARISRGRVLPVLSELSITEKYTYRVAEPQYAAKFGI